jgi:hydroxymethylpyrimidine pyrophosphatase-like HAD family hydrolase
LKKQLVCVIRYTGTGEIVLKKENIPQEEAKKYIKTITENPIYPYSYESKSGSKYEIVPPNSDIPFVKELKNVVRKHGNDYVLEAEELTPKEANEYKIELEIADKDNREALLRENNYARINSRKTYLIVDSTEPLHYFNANSSSKRIETISKKLSCPRCHSTAITTGARGVNWTWGLIGASKTVNRCGSCGYTWKP